MIFSTIIKFISSKEEKFLSKFEQKKQSDIPISFLENNSPKDIDDSNEEINLERFLNKFHFILPGCLRNRIEDYEVEDESDGKKIKFNPFKNTESSPFSTVVKIDGNKTIKLAGKKNIKNTYINKVDSFHGVLIRLNEEGDFCNKEGKRHQTTFLCGCDHRDDHHKERSGFHRFSLSVGSEQAAVVCDPRCSDFRWHRHMGGFTPRKGDVLRR